MKKHINTHAISVAIALMATAASTQATVIFTDDFTSAGTGAWYKGGNSGTLTNTGNALVWTENGNSMEETIARSFTAQTISVGQTIRLTFDYSQNGSTTNNIIRAGFYDVTNAVAANNWAGSGAIDAWQGYSTFVRDNSATGNIARVDSGTDTTGTLGPTQGTANASSPTVTVATITSPTNTTSFNINDNGTVTYQALFEVTRTLTGMTTLFTLSSGSTTHFSVTGSTNTVYSSFDTVVLKQAGTTAMPATYDNIQVSVIPEPGTVALGAFGALALLRRRRI
jgi:hypothetical protein